MTSCVRSSMGACCVILFLIMGWSSSLLGAGEEGAVSLEAKLDEKAQIQLRNVTLKEALSQIQQKTGIE